MPYPPKGVHSAQAAHAQEERPADHQDGQGDRSPQVGEWTKRSAKQRVYSKGNLAGCAARVPQEREQLQRVERAALGEPRSRKVALRVTGPGTSRPLGTIPQPVSGLTLSDDLQRVVLTTRDYFGDGWLMRVAAVSAK